MHGALLGSTLLYKLLEFLRCENCGPLYQTPTVPWSYLANNYCFKCFNGFCRGVCSS